MGDKPPTQEQSVFRRSRPVRLPAGIGSFGRADAWLFICCMLACAAAVAALAPLPIPRTAAAAWMAGYAVLALFWTVDMVRHCEATVSGGERGAAHRIRLLAGTAVHGAVWGLVPVLLAPDLSVGTLELYCGCLMLVCVIFSAGVTASPWLAQVFVASAVLPAAYAWSMQATPVRQVFYLALALTGLASGLVNWRARAVGRWATRAARSSAEDAQALAGRVGLLREAYAAKARALNVASHEIRQPIHAIGLLVERLRLDPQAWQLRPQIDEIANVVDSVSNALALLLDIARLDAGSVRPNLSAFSVRDFLRRLAVEFEPAAAHKGLRLDCIVEDEVWICTDPSLLHSMVANLVANAIRYTDKGRVVLSYARHGTQQLWIHVSDTGPGIPEDSHEQIFDEFYRVSRENQSTQGFGLGLAIVRRTARLLGLEIALESAPAQGSRFSVSVPIAGPSDVARAVAPTVAAPASVSRTLVGLRGLLIENDQVVLKGMEAMVRTWGCRPLVATGMDDLAAKLVHQEDLRFDFIIADYHLGAGALNGLDVIRAVRSRADWPVPAALLTGDLNLRSGSLAPGSGVHLLHKPVSPAKLRGVIERMAAGQAKRSDAAPPSRDTEGNP